MVTMIDQYLWDGEVINKEFQLKDVSIYFTNKRLLLYSDDKNSKNVTEIPYANIDSVDFDEKVNDSGQSVGGFLVMIGFFIIILQDFQFTSLSGLFLIIGIFFLLIGSQKEVHITFHFKNRQPLVLTGEDSVLEEVFKTSRDYRGKIELNK